MSEESSDVGFDLRLVDKIGVDALIDTSRCLAYDLRNKAIVGAFNHELSDCELGGRPLPAPIRKTGRGVIGGPLLRWDGVEFGVSKSYHPRRRYNLQIPSLPGCYVIFVDGVLAYVGSSNNLDQRIGNHFDNRNSPWLTKGHWSRHHFLIKFRLSERFGDYLMWEARLIYRLNPPFNKRKLRSLRNATEECMF